MKFKWICMSLLLTLSSCNGQDEYILSYAKEHPEVLYGVNVEDAEKIYEQRKDHMYSSFCTYRTETSELREANDENGSFMEYLIPLLDKEPSDHNLNDVNFDFDYIFIVYYGYGKPRFPRCSYSFFFNMEKQLMFVVYSFDINNWEDEDDKRFYDLSSEEAKHIKARRDMIVEIASQQEETGSTNTSAYQIRAEQFNRKAGLK